MEHIKKLLQTAGFNDADIETIVKSETIEDAKLQELQSYPKKYFEALLKKDFETSLSAQNLQTIKEVLGLEKADDFSGKSYAEQLKQVKAFFEKQKETAIKEFKDKDGKNLGEILEAVKKENEAKLAELQNTIKAFELEKVETEREKTIQTLMADKKFISSFADENGRKIIAEFLRSRIFGGGNSFRDVGTIKDVLHNEKGEAIQEGSKLRTLSDLASETLTPFLAKSEPNPTAAPTNSNSNTFSGGFGGANGGANDVSLEAILNSYAPLKN